MPADSWEAWDKEDFNKQELEFIQELEQWAEDAADEEVEVSPDFHDRLMEAIREKRTLPIDNQELGLLSESNDYVPQRPSLPISMLHVGELSRTCRRSGCGYQVKFSDEFCPNCGIISPAQKPDFSSDTESFIKAVKPKWTIGSVLSWVFFWPYMPFLLFIAKYLEGWNERKRKSHEISYQKHSNVSMINTGDTIKEHLHNLDVQEPKIRHRLQETPYEISQRTLRLALKKIPDIRQKYQDKLCEIELIRWHNRAMRVYENSLNLSEAAYNARIEQSTRLREEGGKMLDRWEESYSSQMESLERLGRALDMCRRFHRDLMILRDEVLAGQIINMEEELVRFEHSADYSEKMAEIDAFILISDFDEFQQRLELDALNNELNRLLNEEG